MVSLNTINQYGHSFQIKIISSLLSHKKFLLNIYDILSDEYFENLAHKWIIKEIVKYFEKYHTTITMEVLKIELQKVENDILQISIREQLKLAYTASEDDLEYVQEEFTNFCKNQQLKKALMSSVDLLQNGDFDGIRFLVDNALKAGAEKTIGHEYKKDIESRYREDSRNTVATPWSEINLLLQGGLGNGDLGLIYGNPGGGKSWFLAVLGAHAVKLGYNAVHYTLELGDNYTGLRYDSYFTGIPSDKIKKHKDKVKELIEELPGDLVIREWGPMEAGLSSIESHLNQLKEVGFEVDLVLIDYLDLLKPSIQRKSKKEEIDDIYISTKGLAKRLQLPIWTVSQVNRAGAQDKIIEQDKAAGSWDKNYTVDFSMSLSRKRKDKVENTGRLHIQKNRYGFDGMTFFTQFNASNGKIDLHLYDEEKDDPTPKSNFNNPTHYSNEISNEDKKELRKTFFKMKKDF